MLSRADGPQVSGDVTDAPAATAAWLSQALAPPGRESPAVAALVTAGFANASLVAGPVASLDGSNVTRPYPLYDIVQVRPLPPYRPEFVRSVFCAQSLSFF